MRDDTHGYASGYGWQPTPLKPFTVIERTPGGPDIAWGQRTDTTTSSLRYAIDRRDELRRQRRPAYVIDRSGRRVEVARWF